MSYRASEETLRTPPVWWRPALALAAALVWQSTVAPFLTIRGASVSFVLLTVVWYGMRGGMRAGLIFGLVAGACEDALGGTGAAWTLSTGLAGALAGRAATTLLVDSGLTLVPFVAAITLLRYAAFAVVLRAFGEPLPLPAAHVHGILWQAALNAGAALLVPHVFPRLGVARALRY